MAAAFALLVGAGVGYWLGDAAGEERAAAHGVSRAKLRALLERIDDGERLRRELYGILNPDDVRPSDAVAPVPWESDDGR